jgi:hypothetical protein
MKAQNEMLCDHLYPGPSIQTQSRRSHDQSYIVQPGLPERTSLSVFFGIKRSAWEWLKIVLVSPEVSKTGVKIAKIAVQAVGLRGTVLWFLALLQTSPSGINVRVIRFPDIHVKASRGL